MWRGPKTSFKLNVIMTGIRSYGQAGRREGALLRIQFSFLTQGLAAVADIVVGGIRPKAKEDSCNN